MLPVYDLVCCLGAHNNSFLLPRNQLLMALGSRESHDLVYETTLYTGTTEAGRGRGEFAAAAYWLLSCHAGRRAIPICPTPIHPHFIALAIKALTPCFRVTKACGADSDRGEYGDCLS